MTEDEGPQVSGLCTLQRIQTPGSPGAFRGFFQRVQGVAPKPQQKWGAGNACRFWGSSPSCPLDTPFSLDFSSRGPLPPTLPLLVTGVLPRYLEFPQGQAFLQALQRSGQWWEGSVNLGSGTSSLILSELKRNS